MRAAAVGRALTERPEEGMRAIARWTAQAKGDPHGDAVVAIDAALMALIGENRLTYDARAALHAAAQSIDVPHLGLLVFDPQHAIEDDARLREEVEAPSQPTLGARKAHAAQPDRKRLESLLIDPHPMVVQKLVANPKITERDVVAIAARRPTLPECQQVIFESRFRTAPRVRRAIALNPYTAVPLLAGLALTLRPKDLRPLATDRRKPPWLRLLARWILEL